MRKSLRSMPTNWRTVANRGQFSSLAWQIARDASLLVRLNRYFITLRLREFLCGRGLLDCQSLGAQFESSQGGRCRPRSERERGRPGVYARALARLYEANFAPAVMPRKHSHPHLYDRLVSAGVQPDYPRPEPPTPYSIMALSFGFSWVLWSQ